MFLFSNSTTKEWHFCKRAFFNRYLLLGQGVESIYLDEDLLFGTLVHEVLPLMWKNDISIPEAIAERRFKLTQMMVEDGVWEAGLVQEERVKKANEWGRLFEGVCYGIRRTVLPVLQKQYTLVAAEGDGVRWIDKEKQVGLIAKPDTLLYGKESQHVDGFSDPDNDDAGYAGVGYLEWKTVATVNEGWLRQWVKNPQAWTGAITTRAALGIDIDWFMVCGLVKGVDRDGRRSSPWCWIYRCEGETKVASKWRKGEFWWSADYTNAKGWERVSSDLYPGGIQALVSELPEEVVRKQYVLTVPDDIDWELAEEWLHNQKPLIEAVSAWTAPGRPAADDGITLAEEFPRSLEKCNSGQFGNKPCWSKRLCHDPEVKAEPLTWFRKRTPHHDLEKVNG